MMGRAERVRTGLLVVIALAGCEAERNPSEPMRDAGRDGETPRQRAEVRDSGSQAVVRDSDSGAATWSQDAGSDPPPDLSADAGPQEPNDAAVIFPDSGSTALQALDVAGDRGPRGLILAKLVSGRGYSCGASTSGRLVCWGDGSFGSLGTGVYSDTQLAPVAVEAVGFPGASERLAAGGFNTCAIDADKVLRCCGDTVEGLLPTGSTDSNVLGPAGPVPIPNAPERVRHIALGYDRNGVLIDDAEGTASYWNSTGAIAHLEGLSGLKAASTGGEHWCALTGDNGVKCWGRTAFGALGDGQPHIYEPHVQTAMDVVGLASGVKKVVNGWNHACALTEEGGVKCWGIRGMLGNGAESNVPVDVPGLSSGVRALSTSHRHTCALTESELVCWGWNFHGQLGIEQGMEGAGTVDVPTAVPGIEAAAVRAISTGYSHTCVSFKEGGAACWGQNHILGVVTGNTRTPTAIQGL